MFRVSYVQGNRPPDPVNDRQVLIDGVPPTHDEMDPHIDRARLTDAYELVMQQGWPLPLHWVGWDFETHQEAMILARALSNIIEYRTKGALDGLTAARGRRIAEVENHAATRAEEQRALLKRMDAFLPGGSWTTGRSPRADRAGWGE